MEAPKTVDLKDDFPNGQGHGFIIFRDSSYIKLLGTAKSWEVQNFGTAALPTTEMYPAYFRAVKITGANLRAVIKQWHFSRFCS